MKPSSENNAELKNRITNKLKESHLEFEEIEEAINLFNGSVKILYPYDESCIICDNEIILGRIKKIIFN